MDYNNGYNSTAAAAGYLNGHHQSGMTNHHLQHGGHHHHHQNHQNNNNNNKGYGGVGVGGDPLHLIQQQQQHESYDHYGDMLGWLFVQSYFYFIFFFTFSLLGRLLLLMLRR